MSTTNTVGDLDVSVLDQLDFDNDKACEHDMHPDRTEGHADGDVYYCVLSCACTEMRGVILRCEGFMKWCTDNAIKCDECAREVPPGFPWHITISKVE